MTKPKKDTTTMQEPTTPTVNLALTPQSANLIMEALNVAVKAAPNALLQGSALIPIAGQIEQAIHAYNAEVGQPTAG